MAPLLAVFLQHMIIFFYSQQCLCTHRNTATHAHTYTLILTHTRTHSYKPLYAIRDISYGNHGAPLESM